MGDPVFSPDWKPLIDSDKGVVTLKGRVDSEDTKKRAEAVAKKVSGVTAVKNDLQVKGG